MNNRELNIGALCSLFIYVLINVTMWLGSSLITGEALIRTVLISAVLYLVPIGLAYFRAQFAYHILGLIMVFYTLTFVTSAILITDSALSIWVRIINLLLGVVGVFVSIVWFRMVFKNSQKRVAKRLREQQNKK
ncbi:hypothetical protein [Lactobacillus sp. Sy-1]|uniref:hypothetical protein n=1 Tax=Lactobacillus sp. Sy-1 TaxID=2109645 RepID=UPI001C56806B|nr:hypothetical protein [Lactobacillus sp. Sy-1]MBW1604901.1 hypothetical protein [Lactobacillus sp. Sy-1]